MSVTMARSYQPLPQHHRHLMLPNYTFGDRHIASIACRGVLHESEVSGSRTCDLSVVNPGHREIPEISECYEVVIFSRQNFNSFPEFFFRIVTEFCLIEWRFSKFVL